MSAWLDEQNPVLGNEAHSRVQSSNSQCREHSIPPGFSIQLLEQSGETSIPRGFEATNTVEFSPVQKEKALKRHLDLIEKRVTRSQTKQNKESVVRSQKILSRVATGKGTREGGPQESEKTTVSMAKLAKESINVGKLLGLKVIDKEEAALKRITKSLKSERKARLNQKTN